MLDRSYELATTADSMSAAKTETAFVGFDQRFHAAIARLTGGLSPLALSQAYTDWAGHLLMSPDKQVELTRGAAAAWARLLSYCLRARQGADCLLRVEPHPQEPHPPDKRFAGEEWRRWPFNLLSQGFLLTQQWWHEAATECPRRRQAP